MTLTGWLVVATLLDLNSFEKSKVRCGSPTPAMLKCIAVSVVEDVVDSTGGAALNIGTTAAAVELCELSLTLAQSRLQQRQSNGEMGKDMFTSAAECVRMYLLSTLVDDRYERLINVPGPLGHCLAI